MDGDVEALRQLARRLRTQLFNEVANGRMAGAIERVLARLAAAESGRAATGEEGDEESCG